MKYFYVLVFWFLAKPFSLFAINDEINLKDSGHLNVFAGEPTKVLYLEKDGLETTTYARKFEITEEDVEDGIAEKFIRKLEHSNIKDYIELGEEYKKEGGFFKIIDPKVDESYIENNWRYSRMSSYYVFDYFLNYFGLSSGLDEESLKFLLYMGDLNYFIGEYFEPIDKPANDDLVIYEKLYSKDIVHAGIYKSDFGAIQSLVRYFDEAGVFLHDVFFLPSIYDGTPIIAKFFRIKLECPYDAIVELWEKEKDKFKQMYRVEEDGTYRFNPTEDNVVLRKKISSLRGKDLSREFPEIMSLSHINAFGVCANYAIKSALKSRSVIVPFVGTGKLNQVLDKYFILQKTPEIGDLVVYYRLSGLGPVLELDSEPVHYGIYYADEIVESKWGKGDVVRHPIFYVDNIYGTVVKFFKPKEE